LVDDLGLPVAAEALHELSEIVLTLLAPFTLPAGVSAATIRPELARRRVDSGPLTPSEVAAASWLSELELTRVERGPLRGHRIAVKDGIAVAGQAVTAGLAGLHVTAMRDADSVQRLLAAGATVAGISVCEALYLSGSSDTSAHGLVGNPLDRNRSAGGSSSGSAALVAAGIVDGALGTDQAGSVRIPSAWCGVFGLKPTRGTVPYRGALSYDPALDNVGPIARTLDELERLWQVLAQRERSSAPEPPPERLRVGLVREGFNRFDSDPQVDGQVRAAADVLAAAGADVQEVDVPSHLDASAALGILSTLGVGRLIGAGDASAGPVADPALSAAIGAALRIAPAPALVTSAALAGAWAVRHDPSAWRSHGLELAAAVGAGYDSAFADLDVLMMPTVPMTAPHLPTSDDPLDLHVRVALCASGNTGAANLTGHPALSAPCGFVAGMPVGAMLIGPRNDEPALFRAAGLLTATRPGR
jgi:amidase